MHLKTSNRGFTKVYTGKDLLQQGREGIKKGLTPGCMFTVSSFISCVTVDINQPFILLIYSSVKAGDSNSYWHVDGGLPVLVNVSHY